MARKRRDDGTGRRGARWVRENLEAVVGAVAVALLVRTFAAEPYSITTGSMAPTMLGTHLETKCPSCSAPLASAPAYDPSRMAGQETCSTCAIVGQAGTECVACGRLLASARPATGRPAPGRCPSCLQPIPAGSLGEARLRSGDKILVDKVTYRLRSPRRWEVAVFRRPGHLAMNFVKRIIGLPGEELEIIGGDIVVDGEVASKPASLQRSFWFPVTREGLGDWDLDPAHWRKDGGALVGDRRDGETRAPMVRMIADHLDYNALRGLDGENIVGDIRLRAHVAVASGEALLILERNGVEVITALDADGSVTLHVGASTLRGSASIQVGKEILLGCQILDAEISVTVGEVTVLRVPVPWEPSEIRSSRAAIGVRGGTATFARPEVSRDLHYTSPPESAMRFPYRVRSGEYVVLGDNSPSSKDSRYIGAVPAENFVGKAVLVFWPISPWRMQRIR
ncbi:MAG: signal peptidase I [Planctomycetota bacterium]|nr:signal peptidase I [Planctomycetota bacterium]